MSWATRNARMQRKAAHRSSFNRRRPAILRPEVVPFVEVTIVRVPADPQAPIVEVTLVPKKNVDGAK